MNSDTVDRKVTDTLTAPIAQSLAASKDSPCFPVAGLTRLPPLQILSKSNSLDIGVELLAWPPVLHPSLLSASQDPLLTFGCR